MSASTTYEIALALGSVADTKPLLQLLPAQAFGARAQQIAILRLEVFVTSAVATRLHLLSAATAGTAVGPLLGSFASKQNGGADPISFARVASAWGVDPTFTVGDAGYRAMALPGVFGASDVWEWPEPDALAPPTLERTAPPAGPPAFFGPGVCLRNITGGPSGSVLVNIRWKEFFVPGFF
jgi:hypothetical protein